MAHSIGRERLLAPTKDKEMNNTLQNDDWLSRIVDFFRGATPLVRAAHTSPPKLQGVFTVDYARQLVVLEDYPEDVDYPEYIFPLGDSSNTSPKRAGNISYDLGKMKLWQHPNQSGMTGYDVRQHLEDAGLLDQCLSFHEAQVMLRAGLRVFARTMSQAVDQRPRLYLWGTVACDAEDECRVPCLIPGDGAPFLIWAYLKDKLGEGYFTPLIQESASRSLAL
ncbi:MAG: hypothetical protein KBA91_03555 [Candidatus Moranbacteria bacterium]|nr:hypothetical protein [Candidatus Moranbacteria bacterium]